MGSPLNLIDKSTGSVTTVDSDDPRVPGIIAQGYRVETPDESAARVGTEARSAAVQPGEALAQGLRSGFTLGLSNLAAGASRNSSIHANIVEAAHPIQNIIGNIGGAIADPFGALGGIGRLGRGAAEALGASTASAVGRVAATSAEGAAQGALLSAGGYVGDVALGNRDLTTDGFMGAMGKGALWGGATGGLLSAGGEGLMAARRLFPSQEMTEAAVSAAEQHAADTVSLALNDADVMDIAATRRLRQMRDVAATDPAVAAEMAAARPPLTEPTSAPSPAAAETAGVGATPAEGAAAAAPSDLESALAATKARLDAGETLGEVSGARPVRAAFREPIADETPLNERDVPEEARVAARFRTLGEEPPVWQTGSQATVIPAGRGAPNAGFYRGAPKQPSQGALDALNAALGKPAGSPLPGAIGEDAANAAAAKADPAIGDLAQAQQALRQSKSALGEWAGRGAPEAPEAVTGAAWQHGGPEAPASSPDEAIAKALKAPAADINEDVTKLAQTISAHESAAANVAERLGPDAPVSAHEHAQAFRAAQSHASEAADQQIGEAAQAADTMSSHYKAQATPAGVADDYAGAELAGGGANAKPPAAANGRPGGKGGILDAITTMRMMGVPIPSPHMIPVIGPVLDAVLKARVLRKAFGRFGGKVAETTETVAASKAAQTMTRVNASVDAMLSSGGRALTSAASNAGAPAAALGHALFALPGQTPAPASKDLATNYLARADELAAAQQPGAIAKAVKARVQASDPTLTDSLIQGYQRQLGYAYQTMPKPDAPAPMLAGSSPWVPSSCELLTWATRLAAIHDPAAVLERAAAGVPVSKEEIETLQTVSPYLYAHAQERLLAKASTAKTELPHARRVELSALFGVPLDESMRPMTAGFLQSAYGGGPASPSPTPPGRPTISAPVSFGKREMNRIDGGG